MSENIKKLSEKDKVRKRITVWLGASNHIAVIHTVKEIIGNSVDEINKGKGNRIDVTMHNPKTLTIKDNCQGLPLEGKNSDGIENYKLLFETLFAGTKYDNGIDNSDYTVGVNGVFNTVLAFSSQDVTFEVARPDGNIYSISYHKGDLSSPLEVIGKSDETYTKITYSLDDSIFEDNYFMFDELSQIASEQASLIDGVITVNDETSELYAKYHYPNGIKDLLDRHTEGLSSINEPFAFEKTVSHTFRQDGYDYGDNAIEKTDVVKLSVVSKYTKEDENNTQIEFLNGSNLIHHGSIYDGFISGIRNSINKYLRENNMYNKNEKQITKDDVLVGLNYVIDFKSYFPNYANQTKFASYVKYYETIIKEAIEEYMLSYSIEKRFDMERIANSILTEKRSREKSEKTRLDVRKKLSGTVNNISNRIDGFINCKSKNKEETELFIVEGKSALGSTKQGRDAKKQAIYALRGKILNCLKADYDKIFKNDIIVDLIKILGCGVEVKTKKKDLNTFDIDELRWNKIIITTDADVDGYHIRTLLLTMIYKLMPSLIDNGKVFIAESPLYEIENKGNSIFAYSDKEKDEIVSKLKGNVLIQRSKGLGENTAEMMWETTMNPETRKIIQVTNGDIEKAEQMFDTLLGNDLSGRKDYIAENLHKYVEEALD